MTNPFLFVRTRAMRAGGLLRLQATVARDGMVRGFPNPRALGSGALPRRGSGVERAESQGLAFALWAMAALLLSPLTGSYDLVLVLPAYLFAYVNAAWIVQNTERAAYPTLLVGVILIVAAGLHNLMGMPGIHPPVVALVLQYLGAALILKARTNAQGGESAPPLTAPRPLSEAPGPRRGRLPLVRHPRQCADLAELASHLVP